MRRGAGVATTLLALALAACSQPAPPPQPTRDGDESRKSLPDAYKHPPK